MKTKRKGMSYAKWGYIFLAPFFITFFIFQFWPLATTIYYSFFEYFRSGLKIIGPNFVGLKNYAAMIKEVPKYFSNTMIMWLMGFIPQIIVSLVLAAWFTDLRLKLRFQGFFKTVIYMPNLIMASAFAMLFFTLFSNSETGPINSILLKLGIVAEPVRWLSNVWTAGKTRARPSWPCCPIPVTATFPPRCSRIDTEMNDWETAGFWQSPFAFGSALSMRGKFRAFLKLDLFKITKLDISKIPECAILILPTSLEGKCIYGKDKI